MFDVINPSLSIRYRYPSIITTAILSDEEDRENATRAGRGGEKMRFWAYCDNVPTHLSFYSWALLIVIANGISIGNRLLHSLKGMVGSDGQNWILSVRIVFIEPVTSAVMQCLCKPLTIMCCYQRRPREASIFPVPRMASVRGSTIDFKVTNNFWEVINGKKRDCGQCRNICFLKMFMLKTSLL